MTIEDDVTADGTTADGTTLDGTTVDGGRVADLLPISEVVARTGLSADTLRFYEREGVLANPVHRDGAGRRRYAREDIEWLRVCTILRASGMSLPTLRRYTELAREGVGTEAARLALLRAHRTEVEARMAELARSLDLVDHKVRVYEDILDGRVPDHCLAEDAR